MSTHIMTQFRLLAPQSEKISILDTLHKLGVCHLSTREESDVQDILHSDTVIGKSSVISDNLLYLQWLVDQLSQHNIVTKHKTFSDVPVDSLFHKSDTFKESVFVPLRTVHNKIQELVTQERALRDTVDKLKKSPFKSVNFTQSPITQSLLCTVPENFSLSWLHSVKKRIHVLSQGQFLLIRLKTQDYDQTVSLLEKHDCELLALPQVDTTVEAELSVIPSKIEQLKKEQSILSKKLITQLRKHKNTIQQMFTDFTTYSQRYEVTTQFSRSNHTFYAQGYVPTADMNSLLTLQKSSHAHIEIEKPTTAPIKLKNNWYTQKFEFLTKMFGLPKYGFIDPTFMLSVFVPIFFGFMFSDIGYGLMVLLTSLVLLLKAKKHQKVLFDAGSILFISALSTIVFGFLFGSFFGNLIAITPLWFDPFSQAKTLLIVSLAIGVIHLNIGFIFNFIESVQQKKYRQIVFVFCATILLQLGAVVTYFSATVGLLIIAFSVGLFLWYRSLMGIMDITGLVGSWFSYTRLLALALATSGIALGVNIIAQQLQLIGSIGIILSILFLLVGHTFNFLLNILGSSIHSVRLHFIELFSQFYDASGKSFVAYTTKKFDDTL